MKRTYRSLYLRIAAFALALSFGLSARAESPREELAHAYVLLKMAKHDYGGHKATALRELETAGHDLGLDLKGGGSEHERQMKSDELVAESGRMLREASNKLEARDRERAAAHVDRAIHEIDEALRKK
jgi:hypothetical protein